MDAKAAPGAAHAATWPALPYEEWKDTYETLHMWTQIVGKIRLALAPPMNHWWQCALYVTARGLTTSPMPTGERTVEIAFDFLAHNLEIRTSDGALKYMVLYPRPVADFYRELLAILRAIAIPVRINPLPQEVPNPIACDVDTVHNAYDADYANRCWRILVQSDMVFKAHRARFVGKSSPVHFWWGSFDLAVTRFSGRRAPARPGADHVTREAYSHEVISVGFWPGNAQAPHPAYYAYAAPAPPGLAQAHLRPAAAHYDPALAEFLLPYDAVRQAESPRDMLLEFCDSTYEAAAALAGWDRAALDWTPAP